MDREYLQNYLKTYAFPEASVPVLLSAMDAVCADEEMHSTMAQAVEAYAAGGLDNEGMKQLLTAVQEKARDFSVPTETVELLFFLLCTKPLKVFYQQNGLPQRYYDGVASDLISKLNECYAVKGIWGSFVASWFIGFFVLTRLVIGRLQFEMREMPAVISPDGVYCFNGEPAINMHIPSGKPLDIGQVHTAMEEAARVYSDRFAGDEVLFMCSSWLLFPGHYTMLPPESRIRQFMDIFTIIHTMIHLEANNLWRIFNTFDVTDVQKLPRDTALQRSYIRWLEQGNPVGGGLGIKYMKKPE